VQHCQLLYFGKTYKKVLEKEPEKQKKETENQYAPFLKKSF